MKIFIILISFILFKLWLFFMVKHFLSCYKDTTSCVLKRNFSSGIFYILVFLNLAEENDRGLDKGIPSLF